MLTIEKPWDRHVVRRDAELERVRMGPYQGGGAWSDSAAWDAVYELELRTGRVPAETPFIKIYELRETLDRYGVEPPMDVLVAGCGITLLGDLLSYWGHRVTAVDISAVAIEHCRTRQPSVDEERLMACILVMQPHEHGYLVSAPPTESRALLRQRARAGGRLEYRVASWTDSALGEARYDLIAGLSTLKGATGAELAEAMAAFHRLLRPEGLLVLTESNALPRREEFFASARSAGFDTVFDRREPGRLPRPRRRTCVLAFSTG